VCFLPGGKKKSRWKREEAPIVGVFGGESSRRTRERADLKKGGRETGRVVLTKAESHGVEKLLSSLKNRGNGFWGGEV